MNIKKSCRYESEIKYNNYYTFKMVLDEDRHMPPRLDSNKFLLLSPGGSHNNTMGYGVSTFASISQIKWLIATLSDFLGEVEEATNG